MFGFNKNSLKRHKVTERECLEAFIWVGMADTGRLLEIGVEYLINMDWIYHANTARNYYKKVYEKHMKAITHE
jgi:hypothetical protein